ncbi:chemotaxis protein CheW [Pseudoxanthomonas sp. F37]|uniref:chemotaxis protein CheW n=1 Tax=Pseudoxanthomonas TaxID=83618 RepID=UPI001FD1785B|nr:MULTISPECIES: chemotaxis protein CheW [Pseudoxanthomonas]UOV05263.1 chemotaxis protein CheW [Pseudoxanthomonas mexicana]UOV10261.1 chemotaxis protein CheW [Pseudoxanthomonas sp. F37]
MNTPAALDDYLLDLLGDAAAPAATPAAAHIVAVPTVAAAAPDSAAVVAPPVAETAPSAPVLAVAPMRAGSEAGLISDEEFEALLDQLHGDGAPTSVVAAPVAEPAQPAPATAAPVLAVAPARPGAAADVIGDDEFEALLDQLHGGAAPTSRVATPPVPPDVPAARAPTVAPAAPRALAPLPATPYLLATAPDTGERRRATERKTRWLRLRCDQQHYALELLKVQEVVRPATLLPLRGAAPHMLGVMNLRGQVVPVIDLGLYLGRRAVDVDATTRIVVLEEHGEILGLRVTAVEDVANLTDQQIESPDNARVGRMSNPLFRGVARLNECAVILLDASRILA